MFFYLLISLLFSQESENTIFINAVGDIDLGASAEEFTTKEGFDYPFDGTREIIKRGDVNFANLESPFTTRGNPLEKSFTFRTDPRALKAIANAGFNLFSIANNHILDYGVEGLEDTITHLKQLGLQYAGAGMNLKEARKPVIIKVKGKKVALLAYSLTFPKEFYAEAKKPGTAFGHEKWVKESVSRLKEQADIILVSFHWGEELIKSPKPYQKMLAHAAIESGALIVLGHHPHVVQGIEVYRKGVIFYSLGNYVFGSYSKNAVWSIIVSIKVEKDSISEVKVVPINVKNETVLFNPQVLEGESARSVLTELKEISSFLGTEVLIEKSKGFVKM